jgi:magnesium chelatase subunit D
MPANRQRPIYPFTALVGQEPMQLALLLNAVNPRLGGVLIRGEKGTAKSTAVRALANLLPAIDVVEGCPYGCDPDEPTALCDDCSERQAGGETLPRQERRVPMVELPVGATEDRVVGTLDLERAIQEGRRQFDPGLLARANRGILAIDEVNLLQDHLVDTLLDVAAMGRNYVEREGISLSHPAEFLLVGTMNPEEGDLRPQLLDRFALMVEVSGLPDPTERAEVVRRRIAFERNPATFGAVWAAAEAAQRQRLLQARDLLPRVTLDDSLLNVITRICAAFGVDGLRADIVMHRTASTLAALAGRTCVTIADIRQAAELALPHRKRRQPFDQPGVDQEQLQQLLEEHGAAASEPGSVEAGDSTADSTQPDSGDGEGGALPPPSLTNGENNADSTSPSPPAPDRTSSADSPFPIVSPGPLPRPARTHRPTVPRSGRHGAMGTADDSGRYVGSRLPSGPLRHLALAPTLRAAAPYQLARRQGSALLPVLALRLQPCDLRERVHRRHLRNLILFVVDASGSMGAADRMAATKGAILSLLLDAYRKRDQVGLVVFRDSGASLLLPPTNSVERAERLLATLPTGGRTPLAQALYLAAGVLERAIGQGGGCIPFLVLLSDGRANVNLAGISPFPAVLRAATHIRERTARWGGQTLVVDTEAGRTRLGLAREIAKAMAARYLPLEQLRAGVGPAGQALEQSVRSLLTTGASLRTGVGAVQP